MSEAASILLRAAQIVRRGWSRGAPARTSSGDPVVSTAPCPPNASAREAALSPVSFDVNAAIMRASASQRVPHGVKKEDAKLLYWGVRDQRAQRAWQEARARFCLVAKTLHPSDWNDRVCKSSDEAAQMLERAAASFDVDHV